MAQCFLFEATFPALSAGHWGPPPLAGLRSGTHPWWRNPPAGTARCPDWVVPGLAPGAVKALERIADLIPCWGQQGPTSPSLSLQALHRIWAQTYGRREAEAPSLCIVHFSSNPVSSQEMPVVLLVLRGASRGSITCLLGALWLTQFGSVLTGCYLWAWIRNSANPSLKKKHHVACIEHSATKTTNHRMKPQLWGIMRHLANL